jgi:hypothetical protein
MPAIASAEELQAILGRMVSILQESSAIKAKCAYDNASLGITVTDLNTDFCLKLAQGEVSGGPGGAQAARIAISLSSTVLDDLLSGKRDPEYAYTSGSFYLRGSEWDGQSFLRYMPDITAAYKASAGR